MTADPIAKEAHRLISSAATRMMNDDRTEAGSPERRRHVETMSLLWDALGLLCPDECHPEDAPRYREMRQQLQASEQERAT